MSWRDRVVATLTALGIGLGASVASAGHHQWDIVELYSNADGSLQFVELFGFGNGEHNLAIWTLAVDGGASITFGTNLPSATTLNTRVLVATAGFAAAAGVTPDYIIPNGFLPIGGGTLRYAGAADVVTFGALPTNGIDSLSDTGVQAAATPTNFAGQTGSISIPTLPQIGIVLLIGGVLAAIAVLLNRRPARAELA